MSASGRTSLGPAVSRALIALGLVLALGSVNFAIVGKERVIRGGDTIFLELAPVDPRSLMQGDYMALRFRLADAIEARREPSDRARTAPIAIDARGVAALRETNGDGPVIAFRIRNGRVWLGTNAYFFSEGMADRYAAARYGEFKLDPSSGEAVLVALRGAALEPL